MNKLSFTVNTLVLAVTWVIIAWLIWLLFNTDAYAAYHLPVSNQTI